MHIGVAYYPELRKPEDWPLDFEKMREADIRRIRIAEFAWSALEPEPGVYDWEWLDKAIDLAAKAGLEVVLCTPTACPPIWLVERHPDVLPVDKMRRRTLFGARQHRCYNTPAYIGHARQIVEMMAERYGQHPNVVAWQIDNELGGEQKRCYCDNCRVQFRGYVQKTYSTLDALNEQWGNHFWSQDYQRWDQIPVPIQHASDLQMCHHPSLEMAFSRFSSNSIVDFAQMQVDLLRAHTDYPITTNAFMFRWGDNVDWYDLFANMDAIGIDLYTDQLYEIAFYADLCHSIKPGNLWVMEYGARLPNMQTALDTLAAHNGQWAYIFKFNPTPAGQEQSLTSLLTITGEPTQNYERLKHWTPPTVLLNPTNSPRVGLVYDFNSAWAHAIAAWRQPYQARLTYAKYLIHTVYRALFEMGMAARFIRADSDLTALDTVLVPRHIVYDAALEDTLVRFVQAGGKLIVTDDVFQKNTDNVYLTEVPCLYSEALGWYENTFIEVEGDVMPCTTGKAWVLHADASLKAWQNTLEAALAT